MHKGGGIGENSSQFHVTGAETRAVIGGGGGYSYIRDLPGEFSFEISCF